MASSWRIDAKWLSALAAVFLILAACLTYSVYRFTDHQPATGTSASIIKSMTKGALNDERFAELQQSARSHPEAEAQTDELTIPLRGEEIVGITKEEALDRAAVRLADILYYEGVSAGEAYFQDLTPNGEPPTSAEQAPAQEDEGLQLELMALFTQETHDGLRPFALALPLLAAALLALLVLLSRGFGRLGSPGVALAVATGPLALATAALQGVLHNRQSESDSALAGAAGALYPPMADLARTFTLLAAVGVALATVAVLGQTGLALWRRLRSQPAGSQEAPAAEVPDAPSLYVSEEGFSGHRLDEATAAHPDRLPQA